MSLGFTLEELAKILKVRDKGGAPCKQVYALTVEKLAQIESQIIDLTGLRDQMQEMLARWDGQLAVTPDGQAARLLESLILPPSRKDDSG